MQDNTCRVSLSRRDAVKAGTHESPVSAVAFDSRRLMGRQSNPTADIK